MSNKTQESQKDLFPIFTLILSITFLSIIIVLCLLFGQKLSEQPKIVREVVTVTEYVYLRNEEQDNNDSISAGKDNVDEESFVVKEYLGQIGIFSLEDGEVKYVIERYIKTLPEADRRLLQEGFVVTGTLGIYSVIEDYTG